MSRASYGADVFSPVRGDALFNGALCDEKDSDYFGLWQEPYDAVGKNGNSEVKEKDAPIPFLLKDESPSIDSASDNLQLAVKTGSVVGKKNKKVSPSDDDLSRLSYVTTRSRSSHKSEKKLEVIRESKSTHNGMVLKTRKKTSATDRSEEHSNKELTSTKFKQNKDSALSLSFSADSNKELPCSKTKQHKDFSSSAAISSDSNKELPHSKIKQHKNVSSSEAISNKELSPIKIKQNTDSSSSSTISADSNKELPPMKIKKNKILPSSLTPTDTRKKLLSSKMTHNKDSLACLAFNVDSMKSDHNNPGLSDEQTQPHKVLSKRNVMLKKNPSRSKKIEEDSNVVIKKCTQIEETVEMNLDKENKGESENYSAELASSSLVSKPDQIQANIIEKLVKDAVSFEFDGIRQLLYLHQLQVLRNIDRNNVCCCELQKANDELVEENRRLKILIAQQKTS